MGDILDPSAKRLSNNLEFLAEYGCSVGSFSVLNGLGPCRGYYIHEVWVRDPIMFKSEYLLLGIFVWMITLHGTRSNIGRLSGFTIVLGNESVQFRVVKNQSSCSRSGSCCILLHVKELPLIGNSVSSCALMKSLKVNISTHLHPACYGYPEIVYS